MATTIALSLPDFSSDLSGDAKRDAIKKATTNARLPTGKRAFFGRRYLPLLTA